jgi:hypothetical protein
MEVVGLPTGVVVDNVVAFDLSSDRRHVIVIEMCDYYYSDELTKSELESLIRSLSMLSLQMEEK